MVKNLPGSAGDTGSIPGWGTKIPHASKQLSLLALEPQLGIPCDKRVWCNKDSACCSSDLTQPNEYIKKNISLNRSSRFTSNFDIFKYEICPHLWWWKHCSQNQEFDIKWIKEIFSSLKVLILYVLLQYWLWSYNKSNKHIFQTTSSFHLKNKNTKQ